MEAVNRFGLIVGTLRAEDEGVPAQAFSYRPGARRVTLLPGGQTATGVNDAGHIVGYRHDEEPYRTLGFEWVGATVRRELPVPAGYRIEEVTGINGAGQIIGSAYGVFAEPDDPDRDYSLSPGLLWPAGTAAALPTVLQPPAATPRSTRCGRTAGIALATVAVALPAPAASTDTVGRPRNRPAYWLGASVQAVPLPAGYAVGSGEAVNRFGAMVGLRRLRARGSGRRLPH
ncbi:hypothetical protein [Streptomyces sp. NPDC060031]|uniref:hypothetical protein n=1 Tax=Streptomyces sp. NPDC060031 TaxID=3347043 RepID=UPI0036A0A8A4